MINTVAGKVIDIAVIINSFVFVATIVVGRPVPTIFVLIVVVTFVAGTIVTRTLCNRPENTC